MDITCPQCETEYELEDSRVADEGTIVRCTSCNHVFRVVRKSPASEANGTKLENSDKALADNGKKPEGNGKELEDSEKTHRGQSGRVLPSSSPERVWKIRQPGGQIFLCRQLTTLQKWIVEGKVSRNDEISISGGIWKNLGSISELSSFFGIYEEALKARALIAPSATNVLGKPSASSTTQVSTQQSAAPRPRPLSNVSTPKTPMRSPVVSHDDDVNDAPLADELARSKTSRKRSKWLFFILFILMLGGGAWWYFSIYLPQQQSSFVNTPKPQQHPAVNIIAPQADDKSSAIETSAAPQDGMPRRADDKSSAIETSAVPQDGTPQRADDKSSAIETNAAPQDGTPRRVDDKSSAIETSVAPQDTTPQRAD